MNSRSSKSTNNASGPARKDGAFSCLFCHQVPRRRPDHALGPGPAVPARLVHIQARGRRHRPEHVQEGELHRRCRTEQLFGHVKDEFYRGREWKTFEDFKRDLEEYIAHWNTSRRQVRLKGLTPKEFRNQALAA